MAVVPATGVMSPENLKIQTSEFDKLSPRQVASIYAIRYNVFVREQQSIYDEHDGRDFDATHLFVEDRGKVVAYARVYLENPQTAVLGRVAVDKDYRNKQLGRKIVAQAIEAAKTMPGVNNVNIEAQTYLQKFYESFGFIPTSQPYDDAGVMHLNMKVSW